MSSNSKSTIISLAAVVLAVVAILLSFCRGHHNRYVKKTFLQNRWFTSPNAAIYITSIPCNYL
jgi:hypothetical protein